MLGSLYSSGEARGVLVLFVGGKRGPCTLQGREEGSLYSSGEARGVLVLFVGEKQV
jgi:hypothetical protein